MTRQVRSVQGDTIDMVCWRHLNQTRAAVEAVLAHPANHHLVDLGAVLPNGTLVTLPDQVPPPTEPLISLWD